MIFFWRINHCDLTWLASIDGVFFYIIFWRIIRARLTQLAGSYFGQSSWRGWIPTRFYFTCLKDVWYWFGLCFFFHLWTMNIVIVELQLYCFNRATVSSAQKLRRSQTSICNYTLPPQQQSIAPVQRKKKCIFRVLTCHMQCQWEQQYKFP